MKWYRLLVILLLFPLYTYSSTDHSQDSSKNVIKAFIFPAFYVNAVSLGYERLLDEKHSVHFLTEFWLIYSDNEFNHLLNYNLEFREYLENHKTSLRNQFNPPYGYYLMIFTSFLHEVNLNKEGCIIHVLTVGPGIGREFNLSGKLTVDFNIRGGLANGFKCNVSALTLIPIGSLLVGYRF